MSLAEVENMARGVWGHASPGSFGDFRCSEAHSEAYREAHRVS